MSSYVAHAKQNEHGQATGGQPGDQGGEVIIEPWYLRGQNGLVWDVVYRFPDPVKAGMIADFAAACANTDKIGYDQERRASLYYQCVDHAFDLAAIGICDCDCSSLAAVCMIYAGIQGIPPTELYTSNMNQFLPAAGFQILAGDQYTQSGDNLKRGDILHRQGHCAMVIQGNADTPAAQQPETQQPVGLRMWQGWVPYESGTYGSVAALSRMQINGDAYGQYQFDYHYGLVPFMQRCVDYDSTKYSGFNQYIALGPSNPALKNNSALHNLFIQYATDYTTEFCFLQDAAMLEEYYTPARTRIINDYGYDIAVVGPYAVGSLASMAIRFGEQRAASFYAGLAGVPEKDLLETAYARADSYSYSDGSSGDGGRWHDNPTYSQYRAVMDQMATGTEVYQITNGTIPDTGKVPVINPGPGQPVTDPTPTPETDKGPGDYNSGFKNPLWVLHYFSENIPYKLTLEREDG